MPQHVSEHRERTRVYLWVLLRNNASFGGLMADETSI